LASLSASDCESGAVAAGTANGTAATTKTAASVLVGILMLISELIQVRGADRGTHFVQVLEQFEPHRNAIAELTGTVGYPNK
jgi:hypothetical protein